MNEWHSNSLEFLDVQEIVHRQDELLCRHIDYLAHHSPYYRRVFSEHDIDPDDVCRVEDLQNLPFTTKADLEANNNELLCVDEAEIVDLCQTSGTTGEPVVMMQTTNDLDRLGYNEEISFAACGVNSDDRVVIACSLGRNFMAGLAYFLGITRLGAMAIRTGSDSIPLIIKTIQRHRPTALVAVPSMALAMAGRMRKNGDDPSQVGVRKIICIGEPVRNDDLTLSTLGQHLCEAWGANVYGTYASTEMATAFCDCEAENGGHLHPDLVIVEIVDEDGNAVRPGDLGEVVATPLGVTGMPLLRLKTGDIARMHTDPCPCGRQSLRLGPIVGRKSQMLKVRGCTVYPPAIFAALQDFPQIQGSYIEVYDDFELSDRVKLVVGSSDPNLTAAAVAAEVAARTRAKPEVEVKTPAEVRDKIVVKDRRKPVTFFDYRQGTKGR